jgi:hypothetical protein
VLYSTLFFFVGIATVLLLDTLVHRLEAFAGRGNKLPTVEGCPLELQIASNSM